MTYIYLCPNCLLNMEVDHSIKDVSDRNCPQCKEKMVRVIQPVGLVLNGNGWARDGYGKSNTEC